MSRVCYSSLSFFLNHPATTEIYTLSLHDALPILRPHRVFRHRRREARLAEGLADRAVGVEHHLPVVLVGAVRADRKSTRLNSSHLGISYAVFCLKKKNAKYITTIRTQLKRLATVP